MRNIWSMAGPIRDLRLEYCGGTEEKKPSKVRFTSRHEVDQQSVLISRNGGDQDLAE